MYRGRAKNECSLTCVHQGLKVYLAIAVRGTGWRLGGLVFAELLRLVKLLLPPLHIQHCMNIYAYEHT